MLTAHLYNRDERALKRLNRDQVLATRPVPDAAAQGDANGTPVLPDKNGKPKDAVKGAFRGTQSRCRSGELLWIDITAPADDDYQMIAERFDVHEKVLEDLKAREGRPKLHDYGDYLYVVFHALSREPEDGDERELEDEVPLLNGHSGPRMVLKIQEIDCLVGSDYVVTLHDEPAAALDDLKTRWERTPNLMRSGTGYLLYELLDGVLDDYFPLLDDLDEQVTEIEDHLFAAPSGNSRDKRPSAEIFGIKRALVRIRHVAGPTRDVANVLLRRDAEAGGKNFAFYQDLYDHATRIVDMIDTFRDILSGLLDSYLALASNRMNEVMKTLTSVSIMMLVPTLIAGIYGMNFDHMPELHTRYGYFVTLGAMATIIAALYWIFRRKDWL